MYEAVQKSYQWSIAPQTGGLFGLNEKHNLFPKKLILMRRYPNMPGNHLGT